MRSTGLRTLLAAPFVMRRLPATRPQSVLLTFDDGPTPGVTEVVLDRLHKHGARALFFLVGKRVGAAPNLVADIADAGHALGNHSDAHRMASWPRIGGYLADLDRCSVAIERATGRRPVAFRAPGGRINPASILAPRRRGLPHILWNVDPRDYACVSDDEAQRLGSYLADTVRSRDIVLLHDDRPQIVALLDVLLPGLRARGFDLAGGAAAVGSIGETA